MEKRQVNAYMNARSAHDCCTVALRTIVAGARAFQICALDS
jgi:hypothetical protein